jgi:hypothetical protein
VKIRLGVLELIHVAGGRTDRQTYMARLLSTFLELLIPKAAKIVLNLYGDDSKVAEHREK